MFHVDILPPQFITHQFSCVQERSEALSNI
jgi:hypothetical protein